MVDVNNTTPKVGQRRTHEICLVKVPTHTLGPAESTDEINLRAEVITGHTAIGQWETCVSCSNGHDCCFGESLARGHTKYTHTQRGQNRSSQKAKLVQPKECAVRRSDL